MHRIIHILSALFAPVAFVLTITLLPALAFAADVDPADIELTAGAFTLGGGAMMGLVSALAVAAYRKRKALAALDTIEEVIALLVVILPLATMAYAALGAVAGGWQRFAAAVVVALLTALKMNAGPLGEVEPEQVEK